MARFMEMLEDFRAFPPMYECARTQVLLPGDKGYPRQKSVNPLVLDRLAPVEGKEPNWIREARLKRKRMAEQQGAKPHGR